MSTENIHLGFGMNVGRKQFIQLKEDKRDVFFNTFADGDFRSSETEKLN